MKRMKKFMAILAAAALTLGTAFSALAAGATPSITINPNNVQADTSTLAIDYTYYQILEADIDTDPVVGTDGSTTTEGKAAYYVTTQAKATALEGTGLFDVAKVSGQNKWYVGLKTGKTIDDIVTAFDNATFLANFTKQEYTKDANTASAVLPNITAGYYFIKSSLGTKAAVQTLAAVTINEKNSYPEIKKDYTAATDALAGIGDEISYSIEVKIPESVAEKDIVIVDTITEGLTLNTAVTVAGAAAEPAYTSATFVAGTTAGVYNLTIPAATVIANKGKTLTFTYKATVNEKAVVLDPETNTAHLEYDNYKTVETEELETKTLAFDLQKVDGTNTATMLAGAEFSLWDAEKEGNQINLVDISEAGATTKTYRVATAEEAAAAGFRSAAIEAGQARIEGLNDVTYYLQEDVAPVGYNPLEARVAAAATEATSPATNIDYKVENNKGTTLPSTGGMGTTLFYIFGAVLVLGGAVLLVTRRRMED